MNLEMTQSKLRRNKSKNYDSKNGNWDVNNRKSPICDKKSHPRILGISCKWCNSLGAL